ncbi:hypothetical protein [Rugamonas apoptosis]|uniref:Uncharacterized protein n=1 Tax=Rugamonas apoptosis TaxID=2758570 RepID=A0A7W2FAK0_9BURK|nr:hypothetical protein [Rugamonas apoptosis]MBA5688163.1 hypothetical protein [Rugamonas apoptosis]
MRNIIFIVIVLLYLPACHDLPSNILYVNGVPSMPRNSNTIYQYKFRFLERWRIGFSWFDHEPNLSELHGCNFESNQLKGIAGLQSLSEESEGPLWQWHGTVVQPTTLNKNRKEVMFLIGGDIDNGSDFYTVGIYKNGKFERFDNYCEDAFLSEKVGATLKIVKANPLKGTDKWFENSEQLTINGLNWSVNRRWDSPRNKNGVFTVELWVLKIPDTPYLMAMEMKAWVKGGEQSQSDEFNKKRAVFQDIVKSVTLEPITPLVDQEKIMLKEECRRPIPESMATCKFNRGSLLVK